MKLHPEKLAASGFSYIALGGSHEYHSWLENRLICAGALEPIRKKDLGEHGFVEGEWKEGFLTTRFIPFALTVTGKSSFSQRMIPRREPLGGTEERLSREREAGTSTAWRFRACGSRAGTSIRSIF